MVEQFEDSVVYLIALEEDLDGSSVTCFDPSFPLGYTIYCLRQLENVRLWSDFQPVRLSEFAPKWLNVTEDNEQFLP